MVKWEKITQTGSDGSWVNVLYRAKVPGGWLVVVGIYGSGGGITFYPDPQHEWDGSSM